MTGIAGLLVTSEWKESDLAIKMMSGAIRHRKRYAYHTVKHNGSHCVIVGPRSFQGPDNELFFIDRNEDLVFSEETDDVTSISETFGAVTAIVGDRGLSLLRTLDGTRSLYYGSTKDCFAFATERKSLWSIGITLVHALEPGQGVTRPWNAELVKEQFANLEKPKMVDTSRVEILDILRQTLQKSFDRIGVDTSCAVLFSGGVDSSIAAVQVAKRCENTILVTTRSEGAHDETAATQAAAQLNLPIHETELNSEIVWETLPELIYSIETSRQMDVEIALPFYLAAKKAAEEGCTTVVSGQGPDELFAGYARHVKTFVAKGPEALTEQLWNEVLVTHEANIERDERALASHGVDSFFPYLDQEFVSAALSVPAKWKVTPDGKPERKVIFRELAQLMGVPERIAITPKSATQYSSGSSKALLESVIKHVDSFKEISKKKVTKRIQDVLDEIAYQIQIPNIQKKDRHLTIDMEAANRYLDRRGELSSSNER